MVDISPAALNAELRRRAAQPFPDEIAGSFGVGVRLNARDEAARAVAGLVRHKGVFATQAEATAWLEENAAGLVLALFSLPPSAAGAAGGQVITEKFAGRGLVGILFPVGEYEVLLEHACWPSHHQRGPHDLHGTLHRYGGAILGFFVYQAPLEKRLSNPAAPSPASRRRA